MDRTGIIVVSICAILFVGWFVEEQKYQSHLPSPLLATNTTALAQTPALNPSPAASAPVATPWFDPGTNAAENLIVITNANAIYTFTSRGGGLQSVELTKYPDSIHAQAEKRDGDQWLRHANTLGARPAPMLAIGGGPGLVGDGVFTLTKTSDGVRAEKQQLPDGLQLVKRIFTSVRMTLSARA